MGKQDKTERGKTQLARLRKARGLTQTEIAYDLGVSKATYSSWAVSYTHLDVYKRQQPYRKRTDQVHASQTG